MSKGTEPEMSETMSSDVGVPATNRSNGTVFRSDAAFGVDGTRLDDRGLVSYFEKLGARRQEPVERRLRLVPGGRYP